MFSKLNQQPEEFNAPQDAVSYARDSTRMQDSVPDQLYGNRLVAKKFNLNIIAEFSDVSKTGRIVAGRDGYERTLQVLESGRATALITRDVFRLGRDLGDLGTIWRDSKYLRFDIFTTDDGKVNDDNLMLRALEAYQGSRYTSKRITEKCLYLAQQGRFRGKPPYGYEKVPGRPGLPRIVPEQEVNVQLAFHLVGDELFDLDDLIFEFNEVRRILRPDGSLWKKTHFVGDGHRSLGRGMFNNTMYKGLLTYYKHEVRPNPRTGGTSRRLRPEDEWIKADAPHFRIIDPHLWDKVHALTAPMRSYRLRQASKRPPYLLSKMLKCHVCGKSLVIQGYSGTRAILKCFGTHRSRDKAERCTTISNFYYDEVEATFLTALGDELQTKQGLRRYIEQYNDSIARRLPDRDTRIAEIRQRLAAIDQERQRCLRLMLQGAIEDDDGKAEREHLKQEAAMLHEELQEFEGTLLSVDEIATENGRKLLENIASGMKILSRDPFAISKLTVRLKKLISHVVVWPYDDERRFKISIFGKLAALACRSNPVQTSDTRLYTIERDAILKPQIDKFGQRYDRPLLVDHSSRSLDLTDEEWSIVKLQLPPLAGVGAKRRNDDRRVVSGIFYKLRTGTPWMNIPAKYGNASCVLGRYGCWRRKGHLRAIFNALAESLPQSLASIDPEIVRYLRQPPETNPISPMSPPWRQYTPRQS